MDPILLVGVGWLQVLAPVTQGEECGRRTVRAHDPQETVSRRGQTGDGVRAHKRCGGTHESVPRHTKGAGAHRRQVEAQAVVWGHRRRQGSGKRTRSGDQERKD